MDIQEIYALLEQKDDDALKKAIEILENDIEKKQQAEKRYLPFIRTVLKDQKATLVDLNKVAFEEVDTVLFQELKPSYLAEVGYGLDDFQFRKVVDFAGAMIESYIDVPAYLAQCFGFCQIDDFKTFVKSTEAAIKAAIVEDAALYTEGWFGQAFQKMASVDLDKLMLDHGDADSASSSPVLDAFWLYLSVFGSREVYIDMFQSTPLEISTPFNCSRY